jgi:uncharacterized protein (DUF433 family)
MSVQSVTLNVPQTVYDQLQRAAEKEHRSVDEVLLEALTAVAPVLETASPDLQGALAQMAHLNDAAFPTQYPYIEVVERYGGPQPVIKGTRVAVSDIVGYLRLGETPESLVHNILPQLTLAQVHGALSYYYDHQDEIEKILQENTEDYGRAYLREKLGEEGYYRLTGQKS